MSILDLTTQSVEKRKSINIDGQDYGVVLKDELGLRKIHYLQAAGKSIDKKLAREYDNVNEIDSDGEDMETLLNKCTKIILPELPDTILAKLSDSQKINIIQVFGEAVGGKAGTRQLNKKSRTGTQSSPPSNDSTKPETPSAG